MSTPNDLEFEDFELRLDEVSHEEVKLSSSSFAGQPKNDPIIPFAEIAPFLGVSPRSEQDAKELGGRLMKLLFSGEISQLYHTARGSGHFLRLLVSLPTESRLHQLPFELLHDGSRFLARDDRSLIVRFLRINEIVQHPGAEPPLRILVTSACPAQYEPLNLESEEAAIKKALAPYGKNVDLKVFREVTLGELDNVYREAKNNGKPFHIWHHGGHGHLEGESNFKLILHGPEVENSTARLQEMLSQNSALRLAVINTCHSGAPHGLATMLARLAVPAAVGISTAVYDSVAVEFAKAFYPSLHQISIEEAISQTRSRLNTSDDLVEWSKVLLYSRYRRVGPLLLPAKDNDGPGADSFNSHNETEIEQAKKAHAKTTPHGTETTGKDVKGFRTVQNSQAGLK